MCDPKPGVRCAAETREECTSQAIHYAETYPDGPTVEPLTGAEAQFESAAATAGAAARHAALRTEAGVRALDFAVDASNDATVIKCTGDGTAVVEGGTVDLIVRAHPGAVREYTISHHGDGDMPAEVSYGSKDDALAHVKAVLAGRPVTGMKALDYSQVATLRESSMFVMDNSETGELVTYRKPAGGRVLVEPGWDTGIHRPNGYGGGVHVDRAVDPDTGARALSPVITEGR